MSPELQVSLAQRVQLAPLAPQVRTLLAFPEHRDPPGLQAQPALPYLANLEPQVDLASLAPMATLVKKEMLEPLDHRDPEECPVHLEAPDPLAFPPLASLDLTVCPEL